MRTIHLFTYLLLAAFAFVACSNEEKTEWKLSIVDETPITVNQAQGTLRYDSSSGKYIISRDDVQSICGMMYVIENDDDFQLKSLTGNSVIFSGTARKAEWQQSGGKSVEAVSTDYYAVMLTAIEAR